jgi:flavin reductase (DIM6/NTAB) family NADH-FMN oxidoreductase RutF
LSASPRSDSEVSGVALRQAMRRLVTGVTVVTTGRGATTHGMTANAVISASLEPPLMLVSVHRHSRMNGRLRAERRFAINVLSGRQAPLARLFAAAGRPKGLAAAAMLGAGGPGAGAVALVDGALAAVECGLEAVHPAGDHDLFLGRVLEIHLGDVDAEPLMFHDGRLARESGRSCDVAGCAGRA